MKVLPDKYQGKSMPPNFYAELAKTSDSINILGSSGQIEEYKEELTSDDTPIMTKKSLLWMFGLIGSTSYGIEFLEEHNIVEEIVQIAENSEILSVRGTSLFALSLICRSERGKEILKNYRWYRADLQGITCIPSEHIKIFAKIGENDSVPGVTGIEAYSNFEGSI